ncbi:MAG: hypothetical protein M3276_03440 [Actinomycetota bacterium]|nr:hypothetical protein [Actinomycetota bacterium]
MISKPVRRRPRGPEDIEVNFLTHLAIDPDDLSACCDVAALLSAAPRRPARPTRAWMAVSGDGGDTFDDAFLALERDIGFDGPRPIVVDGRLYAFYRIRPQPDAFEGRRSGLAVGGVRRRGRVVGRER